MADQDDVRRIALALPDTSEGADHFGFSVGSLEELHGIADRAKAFGASDDRLDLIDLQADDQKVVTIHSLYLQYILPMMCEFQYWEFPSP